MKRWDPWFCCGVHLWGMDRALMKVFGRALMAWTWWRQRRQNMGQQRNSRNLVRWSTELPDKIQHNFTNKSRAISNKLIYDFSHVTLWSLFLFSFVILEQPSEINLKLLIPVIFADNPSTGNAKPKVTGSESSLAPEAESTVRVKMWVAQLTIKQNSFELWNKWIYKQTDKRNKSDDV